MLEWLILLAPAWVIGALLCFLTAPLGSLMLWRKMSFFAETMAHGALLGVGIAALLQLPIWLGMLLFAIFAVFLLWWLQRSNLPNDGLLALMASSLLCLGMLLIQSSPQLRPELLGYLFGDLISVDWIDVIVCVVVVLTALTLIKTQWQSQLKLSIDPEIAQSEGVNVGAQKLLLMMLLAMFTVIALQAVGSLLISALLVIPALSARLIASSPKQMVIWSFVLAQIGVMTGLWSSVLLDTPSGLSIVLTMGLTFIVIFIGSQCKKKLQNQDQTA